MAPLILEPHEHAFSSARFTIPLQLELEEAALTKPSKKRVRFERDQHVFPTETEYYTDDDIHTKWYSMQELAHIKKSAKELSKTLLRAGKNAVHCDVTMAHRKTTLMLSADFKALVKLTPTSPDQDLQRWCSHTDGRRGLERFSSRDFSCFRRSDVDKTRQAVLSEQARQRVDDQRDDEAIARESRTTSRRPRTLALFFGEADARETQAIKQREAPPMRQPPARKRSKLSDF